MADDSADLAAFLAQVRAELGVAVALRPPVTISQTLPAPLRAFYSITDGFDGPWIEVFSADRVRPLPGVSPGWLVFGADRYFSYCLCSTDDGTERPIDLWDHESGNQPDGAYGTVLDLLRQSYEDQFEQAGGTRPISVVVTALPEGKTVMASTVPQLKRLASTKPSAEFLAGLRALPLAIPSDNGVDAIDVVRCLHALGVSCHLNLSP